MNIDTRDIQFQIFETGKTGFKFLKLDVAGFKRVTNLLGVAEILPVGLERLRTSE